MAKAQIAAKTEGRQEAEGRQVSEAEQQKIAGALTLRGRDGQGHLLDEKGPEIEEKADGLTLTDLRNRLEAELVRHERVFEDFTGGLCTVKPNLTPMQLHERRLLASKLQLDPTAPPRSYREVIALLAEVEFVYPDAK